MKKLTKILLIKWLYFEKELIEVGDINFLTGKNGAGKSTIIDALQIVLLGETNARNFNKAANDSSQRTLDSYLRADMDANSPKSRRGKDFSSYIACEFRDDQSGGRFTTGIVFDCRSDGSRRDQYFIFDGPIPASCFLVDRKAMDIAALRNWLKTQPGFSKMYDSNKGYRDDLLAKWNVHNEQVCRMLKKAVSFRPIVDIQKFITENICDIPDKPDIEAMQQNIRDYKRHEELARRQEEKLKLLSTIAQYFREWQAAVDRLQLHRFLSLWAEKEQLEQNIEKLNREKEDCATGIEREKVHGKELEAEISRRDSRKNELIADRAGSDVFQEQTRLETRKGQLERELRRLMEQISGTALAVKKETADLTRLCSRISQWSEPKELIPLKRAGEDLVSACAPLLDCGPKAFSGSVALFARAKTASDTFSELLRKTAYDLDRMLADLSKELEEDQVTLERLRRDIKDYPAGLSDLKNRLQAQLFQRFQKQVPVEILADVLEIADGEEAWRGAVEGYLSSQKFYLLVDPAFYQEALSIYDQIKWEYGKQSFGLVDIGKLRERERNIPWEDSLAKKVQTDNPLARGYVDYLLGRVVCCSHTNQLRRYRSAITADGMLYQGYVARPIPKARMEDAFIGRKAIDLRVRRLAARRDELKGEIARLKPICEELERQKNREPLFTARFVDETRQRQSEYLQGLEIKKELEGLTEKLSHLDLSWLSKISEQIKDLEKEIGQLREESKKCYGEIGRLENKLHDLEYDRLPEQYQKLSEKGDALSGLFSEKYMQAVGLPRYQQELERLKRPDNVAKNFGDQVPRTQNEESQTQNRLFSARREYVQRFQPCPFHVEAADNQEFEDERKRLEESELPLYREKIRQARESALEQFQSDFLSKLYGSIRSVMEQVKNLNRALRQAQFGTDRYQFKVERSPDYAEYYDMIMSTEGMGEGGIFALPFQQKYGPLVEELFSRITASDDTQVNLRQQSELQKNIALYTNYQTYLKFDLETTDQNGNRQLLSQTLNTKSGGETQTPFYIAVLASFAQLYRVNDSSSFGNTVRLIVFDEAFNKMDSDRIVESVRLLRKMGLQAIICTPPDKLPDIMPQADRTLLVCKEKYIMKVLPYSKEVAGQWNRT